MLNWKPYDQHDWKNCDQKKFTAPERRQFEKLAAKILTLPESSLDRQWGTVHPPGRNALVIEVHPDAGHGLATHGDQRLGVKIYNLKDGKVMWPSVFRFHFSQRSNIPGLPNGHVQSVIAAGTAIDADGRERGYLIQEWVAGMALDQKIAAGLTPDEALQIAADLFQAIVIPLWSQGTNWWDVRDSNYVVTPAGRLVMIDSDTLGGYADEITRTPEIFCGRNGGSLTAMKRYAGLLARMAGRLARRGEKSKIRQQVRTLFARHLRSVFINPFPLPPGWETTATRAWENFRAGYAPLLQPASELRSNESAANNKTNKHKNKQHN
jgi:hypothetical protein